MVTVNIKEKEWLEGVYDRICAKMDATVEGTVIRSPIRRKTEFSMI